MAQQIDGKFLQPDWVHEQPAGTINGSNTVFTLANVPSDSVWVNVYLDGLLQTLTTDYTISGQTITFVTAPAVGQLPRVTYLKEN